MDTFTAPRFESGEILGQFPVVIVRHLNDDAYVVRFEDGHETGAFVDEIKIEVPA